LVTIREADLSESVAGATAGNISRAKSELSQFETTWASVKDAVRQKAPAAADRIEVAIGKAEGELNENPPTQSQYVAALQALLQAVRDANAQLASS